MLKKYAILFFIISNVLNGIVPSIVFVHIGEIPVYVKQSLEQARYMNPDLNIYLLANGEVKSDFYRENNIEIIDVHELELSERHIAFREQHRFRPFIKNGFWVHVTERFFYIEDFMVQKQLENVIHIESDVLLYVDLKEIISIFIENQMELAAPFQLKNSCVPSFVYIRAAESLKALTHHILCEINSYQGQSVEEDVNDMRTLASFERLYGSEKMMRLPLLMPEYAKRYPPEEVKINHEQTTLDFLSKNADLFPGYLFDAATLGIFTKGYDPTVYSSQPGQVHYKSLFDPSHLTMFWDLDSQNRSVPVILFGEEKYRIVNLHMHSKNMEGYLSFEKSLFPFPTKRKN